MNGFCESRTTFHSNRNRKLTSFHHCCPLYGSSRYYTRILRRLTRNCQQYLSWTCHGETFGDPNARKYRVTVRNQRTGECYIRDVPTDRYIWWSFLEQGIELPSSCVNGCCTTCACRVVSGRIEQPLALGLLKEMKNKRYALLCVSYPKSDVEVVLQEEDEVYCRQFGDSFESGGVEYGGIIPEDD
ncbi:ferredoxin [Galdieria sulphuraria]|uniref:Ferredoxin n=1 Tax=Galdieria sulphuraria TaxID=130081 RepID=M2VXX0_GALSU|nr:ferredoxin [Galdieria sulphuraria]EME28146.1 ferredoxin [Galdieria sulphuraria]|eukprot:XP_005704666.1 ferredoxin [Galdieria sulphuraria]